MMTPCLRIEGVTCPVVDCLGRDNPAACDLIRALAENRAMDPRLRPRPPSPDGRVRVGLCCPCLMVGGAEAHQLALARYVDPAKVAFVGCCVVGEQSDPAMVAATAELMPVTFGQPAAIELASRCDVLVTWAVEGLRKLLAGLPDPPVLVSVCHIPIESPWGVRVYAKEAADRFVVVSELALPVLPPETRAKAKVIWNCVDRERLVVRRDRATMRRLWGVPEQSPVAGYLGRLSAEKDPRAMARLAASLPEPWRVVVVGAGCERIAPAANLILPGSDPHAGDVLNAVDVLVVPSEYESFGLTLAEGLAMRKPVVSTQVGIVKLIPGITHTVPANADGPTLARAVLTAYREGTRFEAEAILSRLKPERFGTEWTELLIDAGTIGAKNSIPVPTVSRDTIRERRAAYKAVRECEHRESPNCGCPHVPAICHRPDQDGRQVWMPDCLACIRGSGAMAIAVSASTP